INDGTADSNLATVSLTITAVNDAPLATAESYTTAEDTSLTVNAASGLLTHATDIDGDPLTAVLVSGPSHGTLGLNSDGSFSYTPSANDRRATSELHSHLNSISRLILDTNS